MESVEDHGYIVDIGIKGSNAFLPRKDKPNSQEGTREIACDVQVASLVDHHWIMHLNHRELQSQIGCTVSIFQAPLFFLCLELKVGQYVTSAVEEVKNEGRVVRLSVSRLNSSQTCAQASQGWNLSNLLPGLLVNATIKKVQKTLF